MIKITASVSKKVPINGTDYSSQHYSAGMECELSGGLEPEEIREKFDRLYRLLEETVDRQMDAASDGGGRRSELPEHTRSALKGRLSDKSGAGSNAKGNGRGATEAQRKAIHAIARDRGVEKDALRDHLKEEYGVASTRELSLSEASELIDALKAIET